MVKSGDCKPVRDFSGEARKPVTPTHHLPRTEEKILVMMARAANHEELHHP